MNILDRFKKPSPPAGPQPLNTAEGVKLFRTILLGSPAGRRVLKIILHDLCMFAPTTTDASLHRRNYAIELLTNRLGCTDDKLVDEFLEALNNNDGGRK